MFNYVFGSAGVLFATSVFSAINAGAAAELWENISTISNMLG